MSHVYLEIRDRKSLISFLSEAKKKTGMLKDISVADVEKGMAKVEFPIRIPISLEGVLDLCENPILKKMFGKKVEDTTRKYLKAAMNSTK